METYTNIPTAGFERPVYLDAIQLRMLGCVPKLKDLNLDKATFKANGPGAAAFNYPTITVGPSGWVSLGSKFGGQNRLSTNGVGALRALFFQDIAEHEGVGEEAHSRIAKRQGNALTDSERATLQQLCRPGQQPYQFLAVHLNRLIPSLWQEMRECAELQQRKVQPDGRPFLFDECNIKLFRVQYYTEYQAANMPVGTDECIFETIDAAIATVAGAYSLERERVHKPGGPKGLLTRWRIPLAGDDGYKENLTLTIYEKPAPAASNSDVLVDTVRLEVSFENSRKISTALAGAKPSVLSLVEKGASYAVPVLRAVERAVEHLTPVFSQVELLRALAVCGVRTPQYDLRWVEFATQLAKCSVFDPRLASAKGLKISLHRIDQLAAKTGTGLVERFYCEPAEGFRRYPCYRLVPDWRARFAAALDSAKAYEAQQKRESSVRRCISGDPGATL